MSFEEIDKRIAESGPLLERLDDCMTRIGKMCKDGRPPKMTIPLQWDDDDVFIVATIKEAVELLLALDTLRCEEDGCREAAVMYYCETHAH